MPKIIDRVLRAGEGRVLKRLQGIADAVNAQEAGIQGLTDAELREQTDRFRARLADGETLDDCLLYTSPSPRDRTRSRMPSSA